MLKCDVQLTFDSIATSMHRIKAGHLTALAVTSAKRVAMAPNVPTLTEADVPGFDINGWYAILAPAGIPARIVTRVNASGLGRTHRVRTVAME